MAKAKKKKKAKKAAKAVKARKPAPKKTRVKKAAKKKTVKAAARKAAPRKVAAKKAAPKPKKQIIGEGDYAASRAFQKDEASFVKKNKAKIPDLAKQAESALDGPEGASLKAAEAEAAGHSKAAE